MNISVRLCEMGEDWRWLVQQQGLARALPQIGRGIIELPYRRTHFYLLRRDLTLPFPPARARIELEIRPFQAADLPAVGGIHCPSEARLCARHLEMGHWGLAALHAGRLAGYAWAYTASHPATDRFPFTLGPGQAMCNDAYTAPALRGRGVQSALTLARFQLLKTLGINRALSYISSLNNPSLAVWQNKLGSEIIGEFVFIRFGPWIKVKGSGEILNSGCVL